MRVSTITPAVTRKPSLEVVPTNLTQRTPQLTNARLVLRSGDSEYTSHLVTCIHISSCDLELWPINMTYK